MNFLPTSTREKRTFMNLSQCAATVARHLSATTLFSGSLSTTLRGCNGIGMVSIIFAYPLVQVALAAEPTASEPLLHHCLVSLVEEAKVPSREAGVLFEIVVRDLHKLFGLSKQPSAKIKLAVLADRQCEINPSGAGLMGRRRNQAEQDPHRMGQLHCRHQDRLGKMGMNRNQSA